MKIYWIFLSVTLLAVIVGAQNDDGDEKEESNIPRKVLRKYRIRRPVIVDGTGNAITVPSVPKLRRIRVNKQQLQQQQPILQNIQPRVKSLDLPYPNFKIQQPQALTRQQVYDEESQIVEPIRVVPTYRKATPASTRTALLANVNLKDRSTGDEESKKQHIGTTRNYSKINEDGSFTFGYEGEDGSFKEETRGTDCVVRGKYGYVDPDGVPREFSYVSGNPCDPNDPDKDEVSDDEDEESVRQIQRTPISRPRRPIINQEVQQTLEQTEEPTIYRVTPRQRISTTSAPTQSPYQQPTTFRPRVRINTQLKPTSTAPPSFPIGQHQVLGRSAQPNLRQFLTTQPRVVNHGQRNQILDERGANRAFNFNQEVQQIQYHQQPLPLPQPQLQQYQEPIRVSQVPQQLGQPQQQFRQEQQEQRFGLNSVHRFPNRQYFGGANAASLFQQQQTTPRVQTQTQQFQQPRPIQHHPQIQTNQLQEHQHPTVRNYGNYRTELVFDPATGRYTSVIVQDTPKGDEEFTLTQRLQGFVEPQRPQFQVQTFGQPQVQYYQQEQHQSTNQQLQQYQRPSFQHSPYQFHQPSTGSLTSLHADAQEAMDSPALGQIDAFLSNLNIST